jgi:hypothetical protein
VKPQPRQALAKAGFEDKPDLLEITDDTNTTLNNLMRSG